MSSDFDSAEIEIPCNCGKKLKKTIGWIKLNKRFTCSCGATVDADEFVRELKTVEDSVRELKDVVKKLK